MGVARNPHNDVLGEVTTLIEKGLFLQAFSKGTAELGDVRTWRGPAERLLAARLAEELGSPRLARALRWLAWKENPKNPRCVLAFAQVELHRRGGWFATRVLESFTGWNDQSTDLIGEYLNVRALCAAQLREYDQVTDLLVRASKRASAVSPEVRLTPARVAFLRGHLEEALRLTDGVLGECPHLPAATQLAGRILTLQGSPENALRRIWETLGQVESFGIAMDYANLLIRLGHWESGLHALGYAEKLAPLLERTLRTELEALKTRLARRCGETVLWVNDLPTCAGGILAAMASLAARALQRPAHEVLHALQSEGLDETSGLHLVRSLLEEMGLTVRLFLVTAESARALLQSGHPFGIVKVMGRSTQILHAIGLDSKEGRLLLRDPAAVALEDVPLDSFLRELFHCGPCGIVVVPAATNLAQLPFADQYDKLCALLRARDNDQPEVAAPLAESLVRSRCLPIAIGAALAYSATFHDVSVAIQALDEVSRVLPSDSNLRMKLLQVLERCNFHSRIGKHLRDAWSKAGYFYEDCLFWSGFCSLDSRTLTSAGHWLLMASLKQMPDARWYQRMSRISLLSGDKNSALRFLHLALLADPSDAELGVELAALGREIGRTADALDLVASWARESPLLRAKQTHIRVLREAGREHEAHTQLCALVSSTTWTPAFVVFAVENFVLLHDGERAEALLAEWAGPEGSYSRMLCECLCAENAGDQIRWYASCQKFHARFPQEPATLELLAKASRLQDGRSQARDLVLRVAEVRKLHPGFLRLMVEWVDREREHQHFEELARAFLEIHPGDLDVWSDLAGFFITLGRLDDAESTVRQISARFGWSARGTYLKARLALAKGEVTLARELFEAAARADLRESAAIGFWWHTCRNFEQHYAVVEALGEELLRDPGRGWLAVRWNEYAAPVVSAEERCRFLTKVAGLEGAHWQASLLAAQLLADKAPVLSSRRKVKETCEELIRREPRQSDIWSLYARSLAWCGRPEESLRAWERALSLSPWDSALLEVLQASCDALGRRDRGEVHMSSFLERIPLERRLTLRRITRFIAEEREEEARALAAALLERFPDDGEVVRVALSCVSSGADQHRMVSQLRDAAVRLVGGESAAISYGNFLAQRGMWPELLELSGKVLSKRPTSLAGARMRVLALNGLGRMALARSWLKDWAGADEHAVDIDLLMAECELTSGNPTQALERCLKVLRVLPCVPAAWALVRKIFSEHHTNERECEALEALFASHTRLLNQMPLTVVLALENATRLGEARLIARRLHAAAASGLLEEYEVRHCFEIGLTPDVAPLVAAPLTRLAKVGALPVEIFAVVVRRVFADSAFKTAAMHFRRMLQQDLGRNNPLVAFVRIESAAPGTLARDMTIKVLESAIQRSNELWIFMLGSALERSFPEVVQVVQGWERREGLRTWMLPTLARALWRMGEWEQTYRICQEIERRVTAGRSMCPDGFAAVLAMLAFLDARAGLIPKARRRLARLRMLPHGEGEVRALVVAVEMMLRVLASEMDTKSGKPPPNREVSAAFRELVAISEALHSPLLRRAVEQCDQWLKGHNVFVS